MSLEQDRMKEWFQRVWVDFDLDAVDEMFKQDGQAQGIMPDMALGSNDFKDFVPMVQELLDDIAVDMTMLTQTGPWVQALYRVRALSATNSAPVNAMGQLCARYENGLMVEAYNTFDFFSLFEQLGQLPDMSLALCLSGEKLS